MNTNIASRASDFIQSIGVCAHIDDSSSSYATSPVAQQMAYLGISNMRVEAPYANLSTYTALGKAGIKFDVISSTTNLQQQIGFLNSISSYVAFAEGPNEVNTSPVSYQGLSGAAAAIAYQKDFYAAVHADPLLKGVAVLPFSLSVGGSLTGFGNVSAYADYGNVHGYAGQGVPPYYMLGYAVSSVTTTPGKQTIMTETGSYTLADGNSGVTQDVQAKWGMDTLLENSANGVAKTYLYQLEDNYNNPTSDLENHYGLYTTGGAPKQEAVDLHNLTTILADKGAAAASFAPATLSYNITGLNPNYGFSKLFAKSDGSFDIALWSEPQFYNATTGVTSAVTPSQVTISLGAAYNISVFDPVTGVTAVSNSANANSVRVSLATDPLIIQVTAATVASSGPPPVPTPTPVPAPTPSPVIFGAGPDSLALSISEDAYQGDAQYTVTIDNQAIGGVFTAAASHGAGLSQQVTLKGAWGNGPHSVGVTFLNDLYGGTAQTDRNLYVDQAAYDGQAASGAPAALMGASTVNFGVTATVAPPPPAPSPVIFGAGPDSLALSISEDAYQGDAQYTVTIDNQAIGGVFTAAASHGAGLSQQVTLKGAWGNGPHSVGVTFLNDLYGGTAQTDRNLYVDQAAYDGQAASGAPAALMGASTVNFGVTATVAPPPPAPSPVIFGAGPDSLALSISEDAYQGDAQYTVTIDNQTIGGVFTAGASHGAGLTQQVTLNGTWGSGPHSVGITFLNDLYAGTAQTDRNLYVDQAAYDGRAAAGAPAALLGSGTVNFGVAAGPPPNTVAIHLAEDAWQGDAQYSVAIDGNTVQPNGTVTASNAQGQSQVVNFQTILSAGQHDVAVSFLNDAYGGTAATDRNLYVTGIDLKGSPIAGATASLFSAGTVHFPITVS